MNPIKDVETIFDAIVLLNCRHQNWVLLNYTEEKEPNHRIGSCTEIKTGSKNWPSDSLACNIGNNSIFFKYCIGTSNFLKSISTWSASGKSIFGKRKKKKAPLCTLNCYIVITSSGIGNGYTLSWNALFNTTEKSMDRYNVSLLTPPPTIKTGADRGRKKIGMKLHPIYTDDLIHHPCSLLVSGDEK